METKPPEKKGIFTKLKENIDDHDEQMQVLGAAVRLGVVIWSGFICLLYTSPSPRDATLSRMPSSA